MHCSSFFIYDMISIKLFNDVGNRSNDDKVTMQLFVVSAHYSCIFLGFHKSVLFRLFLHFFA